MLLSSIFCLVWSNALASRRDTAILYSRIGIIILFYCIFLSYNNLFITYLDNGIGLFGGLFYTSSITQTFHILIFVIITGSIFLISSSDLVSIFLSIELQSYGLYLLCSMYRNSESATSAGLTYFLLGSLSCCFILLGIGLIDSNLGVTYLDSFYVINNLAGILNEQQITAYIP